MAQRYDIIRIDFQANARGANAAIESLRKEAEECNERVTKLKQDLKDGIKMGKSTEEIENIRRAINSAQKEARQYSKAYNELTKGMRTLDTAIKAFNDGSLEDMSAAFQKAAFNAADLAIKKLPRLSESYKEDKRQLTALKDATEQNFARMRGDVDEMIKTLKNGGKVSRKALSEEISAQKELLQVLSETDKGYQRTEKNIAVMENYLRAMGGDYEFVRKNISDTKKVSDETLRSMYTELQKTNAEGKVTKDVMRENAAAMREIRAEQARRVESVLGGNLGRQSEQSIRAAIANAKELLLTYKTNSREAQTLSAQIVNAEEHLKAHGIEAARVAARETAAIKTQEEAEKQLQVTMNKRMTSLKTLSADALNETRKYWEAQRNGAEQGTAAFKKAEDALKKIDNLERNRKVQTLDAVLGDPSKHGITEVRNAVQEMERLRDSVQQGIPVWQHYNKMVEQGKAYLDNLAKTDAANRVAEQMLNLTRLSAAGLTEVKKYWEAQIQGAARGSKAYQDAETALKRISTLERTRQEAQANKVLNNMGSYGDAEIRSAIQSMEQLRDRLAHGSKWWDIYNKRVEEGKKYLDDWANADSVMRMEVRMTRLPQLSDAAMTETRKFWETMVAGAEKGSQELIDYENHLQRVKQEESERRQLSNEITAQRLGGNLADLSEREIREAIEAGKQLIQTYKTASPEAEALAKKIVNAEEHLKQYGLVAEQTARKEAAALAEAARKREETHRLMENQLRIDTGLTQSALKAQEQYWQRLIDDPKSAANELARYYVNLNKVHAIQKEQIASEVKAKGISALSFFRGDTSDASKDQITEHAKNLKIYRDSLPQKTNADIIREIDGLLLKAGQSAKNAAELTMPLRDAYRVALQSLQGSFKGTNEQLKQAKKTLEEQLAVADKGTRRYMLLQRALNGISIEEKRVGELTKEVQAVLDSPKGRSFNALKQAVEQGRAALQNMDRTTTEGQKAFDELAKKVKAADIEMKNLGNSSKGTASSFDKAWSRLKTYIGLYVGAAVAMQKLTSTMGDVMELSDKMGEVRKTTGFTEEEVGRLSDTLTKFDTRTALNGLLELSVAAGQLGLKTEEDVIGFTEAANKLMVALPEMGKEGATEMLKVALATGEIDKIRKQMDEGLIKGSSATAVAMEKVGSTIDRLRATSAATAPAITDFVKRVGAVGKQSGISIDQVAALGSTVDALGMRVEMSATALSRMMPAIRNNAFSIAKILGVTPNTIRELYDTGKGMEVILMILQHIKDNNMNADSIESMLGMGGMKEVMSELNQQGARAGIVFGGLSQNVDELRRQLGVASLAYEENKAIQQEYDKMNETTAAKMERLKNQLEETFVGDSAQRWLGKIIDGLRLIVDFVTGNVHPALQVVSDLLKVFLAYWAVLKIGLGEAIFVKSIDGLKSMSEGLTNLISNTQKSIKYSSLLKRANAELAKATTAVAVAEAKQKVAAIEARMAQEGLNKAMVANAWAAVIAAIIAAGFALAKWYNKLSEASKEAAKYQAELNKEQRKVDDLSNSIGKARVKMEDANKEVEEAKTALDAAKKATDGSTESTKKLAKAEADLISAEEKKNMAMASHKQLIEQFNSQYSKYLGFMLSEVSSNLELARARDLVNSKLEESILLKQKEAGLARVEESAGKDRDEAYSRMYDMVYERIKNPTQAARMISDLTKAAANQDERAVYDILVKNNYASGLMQKAVRDYMKELKNVKAERDKVESQTRSQMGVARANSQNGLASQVNAGFINYNRLLKNYRSSKGDDRAKNAAALLQQMDALAEIRDNAASYYDMSNPELEKKYRRQFQQLNDWKGYDRNALLKEAGKYYTPRRTVTGGDKGLFTPGGKYTEGLNDNVWGQPLPASSTRYADMNADVLVNRRKQMNEFVRSIQTDSDVESVLAEDEALRAAIEKGMSKDMRTVVEWYNTERLKIQDELHRRHLTNTGDWMDPKASRARKRMLRSELKAFLEELDAYYTERKTKIEEERNNEEITEGEAWRRQIKNDEEWYTRRAELIKLYADKWGEVTEKSQNAIFDILAERTGETTDYLRKEVKGTNEFAKAIGKMGDKGEKEKREWDAFLGLAEEKSYLKAAKAVGREVKFIQDTLAKERPYDGITKNLQENLEKMGILTRDLHEANEKAVEAGLPKPYNNDAIMKATNERLAFLLGEAADAYGKDINWIMHRMGEKNMQAWADSIAGSSLMKQALMGQLHAAYDAVQEAIKKEANQLRKQVDIQWNDDTLGPNGKSRKSMFDMMIATLGIQQDAVSRANSLIGAGAVSENVAARIAMKQMEVQMRMQRAQYDMLRVKAQQRMQDLKEQEEEERRIAELMREQNNLAEAARHETEADNAMWDAQNVKKALGLTLSEETKKEQEQLTELTKLQEESQNRLYRALKEWAGLLSGSLQTVFEASNAGNAEYYNELAKLRLTGKGGPGAGTFVVIENSGTENAQAHYEYLSERESLERHREIERENALADAWKKVMDDINMKMSEAITDQINAILQNASIDTNTDALDTNTKAILGLTEAISEQGKGAGVDLGGGSSISEQAAASAESSANRQIEAINKADFALQEHFHNQVETAKDANKKTQTSTQSMFAKMTAAANLYGIAYQAMSNSNLSTTQRIEMVAVQAAGNAAIAMLTADLSQSTGEVASTLPAILAKCLKINPIGGAAIFAVLSAMIGGLMGMAMSKITKSKSEIAQATGASGANAGRLTTGMLAYAEGNVNEFTDPGTLKEGRQYNVDAADGRTYRARYMGRNPRTHITSGPEFHLSGERGREMIIDANTTRQITMNDGEIWHAIQTISNHRMRSGIRRGRGVRAFADGNVEDFTEMADAGAAGGVAGISVDMAVALQASIDRQSDLLERALRQGIKGVFRVDGPDGLVNTYDKGKALATKHGQKYP